MRHIFQISAFIINVMIPLSVQSQGCSDAGFCSVQSIKTTEEVDSILQFQK